MNKQEILDKHDTSGKYIEQTCRPELFAAMDEYAKQQAIAFDEWKVSNKYRASLNMFGELVHEDDSGYCYNTQELYNQFIEQQNKP